MLSKPLRNTFFALCGAVLFVSVSLVLPLLSVANEPPARIASYTASEREQLQRADRLFIDGNRAAAEQIYRRIKPSFTTTSQFLFASPIEEPTALPAAGQVYWREAQESLDSDNEDRIDAAFTQLLNEYPQFVPAYLEYAEFLQDDKREEEALEVLERGVARLPSSAELTMAQVEALADDKQHLEASVAARQFAVTYPDHPQAEEFNARADKGLKKFRGRLRRKLILEGLLSTGVGVLTGNEIGAGIRAVQIAQLMLSGESGVGEQVATSIRQQVPLVTDPLVTTYVNEMGQQLASLMGRSEFNYEFDVIQDDTLNAFALPGGKVFINSGAIMRANSEAELAGLIGHEIAHAVLSHGFQRIVKNNLLASLGDVLPFGDFLAALVSLDYSRGQERQSDLLGTRVLSSSNYAADGLRNLFVTLRDSSSGSPPPYLSTHPAPASRVDYLEELIIENGYNRFAYEGVGSHGRVQNRLRQISKNPAPESPMLDLLHAIQNRENGEIATASS